MKKVKILRIITRLNIGGPAIHTVLLTAGLDSLRFESLLVCGNIAKDEGDMYYYADEKKVRPIFIPELRRKLNFWDDISAFKKIYHIIKIERPDIIHTHTAKAGTLGRFAAILYNLLRPHTNKKVKIVHTFHGHIFEGYFNKFKTKLFILIELFLAKFSYKIITVSDSLKKELISLGIGNNNKIIVIPLGLELDKLLNVTPRDNPVLNIGIIGRLVPIKNHRLFLETAAKIIKDKPQLKLEFKIIGDGELRNELEEYTRQLNLDAQVDFLGWQKDLPRVYADLDIVALTSINEGTPVSLIEAMASGKAIVATNVGGVKDLLGDEIDINLKPNADFKVLERGLLVKPEDPLSFAAALIFIIEHSDLKKDMAVRSREFVKNKFSKERLIKDIESLYDNLK